MTDIKLPAAVCAVVGDVLAARGTHPTLDVLFQEAGAPGEPPDMAHSAKWKTWLRRAGNDPDVDALAMLGHVIEEFMDVPPTRGGADLFDLEKLIEVYNIDKQRVVDVLEKYGLRYFQAGRVIPEGQRVVLTGEHPSSPIDSETPRKPTSLEELLRRVIRGLPRAMHPLAHRRKHATSLSFGTEWDIQDLLHALLRPWIADIRPEECTPSYGGKSTRMDFLLPKHELVIEVKRIRDAKHAKDVVNELTIDVAHYQRHPQCRTLWCVIYDLDGLISNPAGMVRDLEGKRTNADGSIEVRPIICGAALVS